MKIISTTEALGEFCQMATGYDYVTIDTEFLRERTYYSKLCLIQMAVPEKGEDSAVIIDTLSPKLDLAPLYELFKEPSTVKVFHAARQDLEIFFVDAGIFPEPFFDTQVAAMVCGFGEQVGYETLVRKIAKEGLDKSSRFTDWSQRPLSERQMSYALGDVTHLREIYEHLSAAIAKSGRTAWVEEELTVLTDPATYTVEPEDAWKRVKTRTSSGKFLAIVRELARFRETYAQTKNIPRNRVFKDEALIEMASNKPRSHQDLGKSRLLLREARKGAIADGILKAIKDGVACPPDAFPKAQPGRVKVQGNEGLAELLRVLLKAKAEGAGVAQKLIATTADLDAIASGDNAVPALNGWRRDVFGNDALRLCEGKIALSANGKTVKIVEI